MEPKWLPHCWSCGAQVRIKWQDYTGAFAVESACGRTGTMTAQDKRFFHVKFDTRCQESPLVKSAWRTLDRARRA